ncbi:MAG TPA: hypothetical protein VEG66_08490 [Thermoplasmata archaeon]|jgi:hypothetical protein|nr:hypothetical protein [Thermoplasmata archaeon]
MSDSRSAGSTATRARDAEAVLRKLGYAKVSNPRREPTVEPSFWVQESGVPRRTFPVFVPTGEPLSVEAGIERWVDGVRTARPSQRRAIFVVPTDETAEEAWARFSRMAGRSAIDHEVSILVVPPSGRSDDVPHFHLRVAEPREILAISTGIVVGLFRRAAGEEGGNPVDFEELLTLLTTRFGIDVHRSLGVRSDEDALYILYQLALRDSYAPGDAGSNLHTLVLKPTGPAARLPWYAA